MTAETTDSGHAARPHGVAVIYAAHFLVGMDGLAVTIALPALKDDLGLAAVDAQWAITAYTACLGGLLLLGGRLADAWGRRRLVAGGLALFSVGSLVTGLAPGLALIIPGRALQGAGAAAAMPAGLALIATLHPPGPARTRAFSILAVAASAGILTGLVAGGLIAGALGWRAALLLFAPVSAAASLAAMRTLPEARSATAGSLAVAGALKLTAAMFLLVLGLTGVARWGAESPRTLVPLAAGAALVVALRPHGGLLRLRSLRAASLAIACNGAAFCGVAYVGSLHLQDALGYTPGEAGLALAPIDAASLVTGLLAGRLLGGRSVRAIAVASFAATCAALLWLARVPAAYATDMLAPLLILGVSLTLAFVLLTREAVSEIGRDEQGTAGGVFETANHLGGGVVAVAVYATVAGAGGAFASAAAFAAAGAVVCGTALGRAQQSGPCGSSSSGRETSAVT